MPFWGIFKLEFLKTIFNFKISTLEFVKSEFLTHTVNFGVESDFSKAPRSSCSKE